MNFTGYLWEVRYSSLAHFINNKTSVLRCQAARASLHNDCGWVCSLAALSSLFPVASNEAAT